MYDWEIWLDHVTDPSNVFTVVDNGNGTWTITPAGTVMQQGTPQDQAHFNNIEAGVLDAHAAHALLLNFARQTGWRVDDIEAYIKDQNIVYVGTTQLTNTLSFPFNDSQKSVSIGATLDNAYYDVATQVTESVGNVGEVEVVDKLTNGFKLRYTGSASSATVAWIVAPRTVATPIV